MQFPAALDFQAPHIEPPALPVDGAPLQVESTYSAPLLNTAATIAPVTDAGNVTLWYGWRESITATITAPHPDDDRPQRAMEQARAWSRGEISMTQAREAAFAAHIAERFGLYARPYTQQPAMKQDATSVAGSANSLPHSSAI